MKAACRDATKPGRSAFNVAVADFFNAPGIITHEEQDLK
jgi:hypothetical protein